MSSRDAPNTINSSQPRSEMDNTVRRQPLPQQTSDLLCHHQHPNLQHHRQVEHYCDQQQQVDHRASLGSFGRAQGNAAHPSTTMSMETMSHTRGQRNDHKSGDQSTPMAATTPPTSTSRTAMSQKRQNIMQRRIEMRRRNEERQKQLQLQRDEHERQTQNQHEPYRRQIGSQDVKWNDCGYQHQESQCSVENDNTTARKVGRQSRPISKRIVNNHHLHSRKMHQNVPPSQKDYNMKPDHYQQNHPHYPINQSFYHPSNPMHNKFMNQDITSQKASTTDADQRITHTKSRESEQQIQEQSRVVSPVVEYQSNNFTKFPHSNSNFDRQHFNSRKYHEDYGPYHNESPSPIVQSPPVLQRTQQSQNYNANPEGVFDGNYFSEQYLSDDGGPSSYQRSAQSASRIVSPNESPSDEGFGIRGARSHRLGKGVTSASMTNQHQHHLHSDDYDEQQIKRPCGKQSNNLLPMQQNFQSNQRHQNHQNQEQPDWHEINRQHIYQKQLTVRQQRLQSEQPQCVSNQSHQHNPSAPPPCQVPLKNNAPYFQRREHPSYFSPVEALDKRNDQIQRKTKMTIKKPHSINNGANRNSHLPKSQLDNHGNIDEDTISVSDRARKYLDAHGHAREGPLQYESTDSHWNDASNSYHLREPSKFPRPNGGVHRNEGQGKASRRLISQSSLKYSEQSYPERAPKNTSQSSRYLSLFDEETVSGSVASLKREWEERAANNYQNDSSHQPYHEGKNFNCMLEGKADYSRYLRQRGQRRTIDEKTRRKDVRSLPPERRNNQDNIERTGKFCHGIDRVHRDGYQSDGPGRGDSIRPPHHRSHESDNSTPLSVKDARRRLWDQNEKLRAWLPKSGSFESSGDARDRSTGNSASPGDMSGSSGSALFKSKFVHAAAVAAKKRANFDPLPNKNNEAISKYPTPKSAAVSSHLTDSTAETTAITTPAGSNGSSYRTQSNVARRRDHSKLSVHQEFEPNEFLDENSNLSNNCTAHPLLKSSNMIPEEIDDDVDFDLPHHSHQPPQIAPLLDERPRSSVSDLIAKLNAVSRANPAQALATIDSILRAECGRTPEQNDEGIVSSAQNTLREIRSNCTSGRASSPVRQPLGEDFFREHRNNSDLGKMHDIVDDPEQDSQLSSDDSTVSSMTNPTYQSMGETANNLSVNSKLAKSQRIPLSRSIVSSHARAHNTGRQSPILPPTYKTESCKSTKGLIESNRRESKYKQEHPDSKKSSHTNEISAPSDKHSDCCITSSIDDVYSDGKQSKNGGSSTRRTSSHKQYSPAIREHSLTEARSDAFDSNWESVPHSNFFSSAREVFASANNRQGSNIDDLTKREKGWRNQHSESNDARIKSIKYSFPSQQAQSQATHTSFPETDDDRFSLLPHVISDAFSNVDISLDEAPRLQTSNAPNESRSIEGPSSSLQTISHAFSDVDISLDHMKTVKQRKKELESLSKPSASKGLNDNTDGRKNERKNGTINAAESPPTWLNQDDGKDTSDTGKSKPRKLMEPKLRLKGNTKLTQKFARLMKAFEDDY